MSGGCLRITVPRSILIPSFLRHPFPRNEISPLWVYIKAAHDLRLFSPRDLIWPSQKKSTGTPKQSEDVTNLAFQPQKENTKGKWFYQISSFGGLTFMKQKWNKHVFKCVAFQVVCQQKPCTSDLDMGDPQFYRSILVLRRHVGRNSQTAQTKPPLISAISRVQKISQETILVPGPG